MNRQERVERAGYYLLGAIGIMGMGMGMEIGMG